MVKGSLNNSFNANVDSDVKVSNIIVDNSWCLSNPENDFTMDMKNCINVVHLPIHHCREVLLPRAQILMPSLALRVLMSLYIVISLA